MNNFLIGYKYKKSQTRFVWPLWKPLFCSKTTFKFWIQTRWWFRKLSTTVVAGGRQPALCSGWGTRRWQSWCEAWPRPVRDTGRCTAWSSDCCSGHTGLAAWWVLPPSDLHCSAWLITEMRIELHTLEFITNQGRATDTLFVKSQFSEWSSIWCADLRD